MAIELIGKCASHWATLMICSYGEIMSLTLGLEDSHEFTRNSQSPQKYNGGFFHVSK